MFLRWSVVPILIASQVWDSSMAGWANCRVRLLSGQGHIMGIANKF